MNTQVKIVTDSTLDLPMDVIKKLDITIVPLTVTIDGESYLDGIDISSSEFSKMLVNAKDVPGSSQPSTGQFLEVYDRLGKDGNPIISIHMTSGMSGTFNSAKTASEMTDLDVTVVDSNFISVALGFQVREAAEMALKGANVQEILDRLEQVRKNSSLYIMVDTLEYLAKGGRIGRGRALLGSLLKIKPIASLDDGVYTPINKVRTYMQMIKFMKKKFEEETSGKIVKGVGIAQIEAKELAIQLRDVLSQMTDFEDIFIIETTPIVSTHTGPGALALMYYFDDK
ncbi:fatty acid-binding protein DegV [Salipaludibacillus neizhouensis]|uniref:Fatty acid-binding protein DegV n=1 Tax=Salipaludibacillus neizhouensis TaxID=885475 RepID=A0A3A9K4F7_9BACI|nr:DegV family protein [Salipaludibacillus neizhouensis]RKL67517.1 fatty acid-binding protein DegV [Salipaludibacillus neizhouensis]